MVVIALLAGMVSQALSTCDTLTGVILERQWITAPNNLCVEVVDCTFADHRQTELDGGVILFDTSSATILVRRCLFQNCLGYRGGALYFAQGRSSILECRGIECQAAFTASFATVDSPGTSESEIAQTTMLGCASYNAPIVKVIYDTTWRSLCERDRLQRH
jgi:hypothetical protein